MRPQFFLYTGLLLVIGSCATLSGCRTLKRNSNKELLEQTSSQQVSVKKQETSQATETTSTKEQADREGDVSWGIKLSSDSDATPFLYTLPDGSVFSGRAKGISGTGKTTEQRNTETRQQKSVQHSAESDSNAKQKVAIGWITKTVTTTRDANSFWRPVAIVFLLITLVLSAYLYFKPRIPFLSKA
ncbi:MAG: hypothetical protein EOP52_13410 [Sphingobacteriales bacterium]|nr:MAG: hypothetical protein EOP52_13410 [Sphingobacteriales bacterium]